MHYYHFQKRKNIRPFDPTQGLRVFVGPEYLLSECSMLYAIMDLSNYNIDYIKTCNNDNIGMKSANLYF